MRNERASTETAYGPWLQLGFVPSYDVDGRGVSLAQ